MDKICCVVCNYNKRDFVVACVESLMNQTYNNIDIVVVDNASIDDSVEFLSKKFGEKITIFVNEDNKGGSGGFNAGLIEALKRDNKYIMLIDNDVVLDKNCIDIMYKYMEKHEEIGILGPTVRMMRDPEKVQDLGGSLTIEYKMKGNFFGELDNGLPNEMECDYISTCAAMARTEAVKKFGIMPEDNFIYWDDVEWSTKCHLAGYKTVAINEAKVWHNFQTANIASFNIYYLSRNRLNYYAHYLKDNEIDNFIETYLDDTFVYLYGYKAKGYSEIVDAYINSIDDFVHHIRGKASPEKLPSFNNKKTLFQNIISDKKIIRIKFMDNYREDNLLDIFYVFLFMIKKIIEVSIPEKIIVDLSTSTYSEDLFKENLSLAIETCVFKDDLPTIEIYKGEESDIILQMCEHVNLVNESILPEIYIDRYCNVIASENDLKIFSMYGEAKELFKLLYRPLIKSTIVELRKKKGCGEACS